MNKLAKVSLWGLGISLNCVAVMQGLAQVTVVPAPSTKTAASTTTVPEALEALTPEKQAAIDQFMNLAGSAHNNIGENIAHALIQQITQAIQKANPQMPAQAQPIIEEEVKAVINSKTQGPGSLQQTVYAVYNQYLTLAELQELIAFYQTPLGKKLTSIMPTLLHETALASQKWAQALAPEIKARISMRFIQAGIELK